MRRHRILLPGLLWPVLAAGLLLPSIGQAAEERPFSFRPDLPERSPGSSSPVAQQRAYGYDSALRSEIRRLEQRREPLGSSAAARLNRARSELQRLRNARR